MLLEVQYLALGIAILLSSSSAQLGLNEERDDLLRHVDCNVDCQESKAKNPVCGTNGRTYDSRCDLERDICKKVKVQLKHTGECSLAEKCFDERRFKQEQLDNGETAYVPNCRPDGSYSPVQCHNFTRFCWCSRVDGKPIPETIQKDTEPQCSGEHHAAPPTEPPSQERCSGKKRKSFLNSLVNHLAEEYKRHTGSSKRRSRGQPSERLRIQAAKWKFSDLDLDNDGQLKRHEYRNLSRMVRNYLKPRKCSKLFPRFCDGDNNGRISRNEWVDCFTQRSRSTSNKPKICRRKNCPKNKTKPVHSNPSCEREREMLLSTENAGNTSIPIPVCAPNGKYEKVQCYREYCWCVDTETGNSLDGTTVTNGTPDCSRPFPHIREWPDCKGKTKIKFLNDLQEYLMSSMSDADSGDRNAGVDVATQSREEYAAVYHFERLDKNNDKVLERQEKKSAKRFLTSSPKLKLCGRKFTRYCDVDKNRKISLAEWVACIVVPHKNSNSSDGDHNDAGRRIEDNPFLIYLTPEDEVVRLRYRNW